MIAGPFQPKPVGDEQKLIHSQQRFTGDASRRVNHQPPESPQVKCFRKAHATTVMTIKGVDRQGVDKKNQPKNQ